MEGIGVYIWKMDTAYCKVLLKTQGTSELRSTGPKLVPLLAMRCLSLEALRGHEGGWGYMWQNSSLTNRLITCHAHLQKYHSWQLDFCSGSRGCQGASRGVGGITGLAGGVRGHLGGRWTRNPTTLGPSPGSQHSHWFLLGNNLPHQGQARAPVQSPITPTGFSGGVTCLTNARQITEMNSAGYYIHLALHLMTVYPFISMLPNHIFLHAM